jgi:hypothetical protein
MEYGQINTDAYNEDIDSDEGMELTLTQKTEQAGVAHIVHAWIMRGQINSVGFFYTETLFKIFTSPTLGALHLIRHQPQQQQCNANWFIFL